MLIAPHCRRCPCIIGIPYDRLLIAQATVEEVPVITADPLFAAYGIDIIW